MEELQGIINNIKNGNLRTKEIQKILLIAQQAKNKAIVKTEWNYISEIIWEELQKEHDNFDDQLLFCTAFYTLLSLTGNQEYYLDKILKLVQNEVISQSECSTACVCLVYGMFQSSFLSKKGSSYPSVLGDILQQMFELLVSMANDYSRYTFIVFKVISLFKKVIDTEFEIFIYTTDNKIKLLNIVNHNWENPITGIKDLNRFIFRTLISVIDSEKLDDVIDEIHSFNWNKAKYLMLSEIIEYKSNVDLFLQDQDWIDGALNSLHKPGLASAGADMYYSILNSMNTKEQWCLLFLQKVIDIATGSSRRVMLNFCNYWCLTTFRTFPALIDIILNNILEKPKSEITNFSIICIWKQANKLGCLEKEWGQEHFRALIQQCLEESDIQMRIFAFDIVCVSKFNTMPCQIELDLMANFIVNNINSDSTVLRMNMLCSLKFFLIRVHSAFASSYKRSNISAINDDLALFCTQIQNLLVKSLDMRGNYQRKITALKLCCVFLQYFTEIPKKKQEYKTNYSLLNALEEQGLWTLTQKSFMNSLMSLLTDPAADIRDSAMHLLLEYHFKYLESPEMFQNLNEKALENIKSKFFYEINCGHTFFKLILKIVEKEEQPGAMFKNVDDIFEFAFKEFVAEFELRRDVVQSIEAGKQLHSFLAIMSAALGAGGLQPRRRVPPLDQERMELLLTSMEEISNQFTTASDESSNADFSKISDIVVDTITKSGHSTDDKDPNKISGIYQIVLNCMWLNVKETCVLASLLIKHYEQPEVSLRCLNIITHVLETSRHKGAIEAAGLVLGQSIHYLTSLPKDSARSRLPESLLTSKLAKLVAAASAASVTRRGAGLTVLLHRIVASDAHKGKPLFHYFMKILLLSCSSTEDVPASLGARPDMDNERDLPKAVYLHFLTRIVFDSGLASDLMFYSAGLAELAFDNLTSKYWQIRNAALQLYGALIPKLIGQNKQSGADEGTIATVACDEFRAHSPRLWRLVLRALHAAPGHARLVPAVHLLASCAKRYNFRSDTQQFTEETALVEDLFELIASPVHTVRRLAAKCIYNILPFEDVYQRLAAQTVAITENTLHGMLMLTQLYHKQMRDADMAKFANLAQLFTSIFNHKERSYTSRAIFDDMFLAGDFHSLEKAFIAHERNAHKPNVSNWIKVQIVRTLRNCAKEEFPQIIMMIMNQSHYEAFYEILLQELDHRNVTHLQSLPLVAEFLLEKSERFNADVVWKILYGASLHIKIANISNAVKYFESNVIDLRNKYILPFLARTIQPDDAILLKLSDLVFSLSDSETADYDMRLVAAFSNNEFGKRFGELNDSVKIYAVKTAVVLLQDEDEDIRYLNVDFHRNVTESAYRLHPYICLQRIIDHDFLKLIFKNSKCISRLCNDLLQLLSDAKVSGNTDGYNPFSIDTNNIYKENEFTTCLVMSLFSQLTVE